MTKLRGRLVRAVVIDGEWIVVTLTENREGGSTITFRPHGAWKSSAVGLTLSSVYHAACAKMAEIRREERKRKRSRGGVLESLFGR